MPKKKDKKNPAKVSAKGTKKATTTVREGGTNAIIAAARAAAFTDESPAAAFHHFRSLAEAVPGEAVSVFTGQPLLMRANIKTALEAIEPHLGLAVERLREPGLKEVFELPALVMALDFASGRVPVARLSAGEIDRMLAEGAPWRELMLTYLEVVSHPLIGLLPRERVAAVRAGTGKLDKAQDFVALAGLFAEFAAPLAGKHPFAEAEMERLATLGGALVQQLQPGGAPTKTPKRSPEAILRDRFGWLVVERYDQLQVLATVALGKRQADDLLPALRASGPAVSPATPAPAEPAPAKPA
jgi:hypothetical protein